MLKSKYISKTLPISQCESSCSSKTAYLENQLLFNFNILQMLSKMQMPQYKSMYGPTLAVLHPSVSHLDSQLPKLIFKHCNTRIKFE